VSRAAPRSNGARRAEIVAAAVEQFGRDSYEHTKWGDIADAVGVGPTALYHYFDSKQHCLYVILDDAIQDLLERIAAVSAEEPDAQKALLRVLVECFKLSEHEVLRNRVLAAQVAVLSNPGAAPREERARLSGRSHLRDLQIALSSLLAAAMEQGAIPKRDPRLLARAALGLYGSIWQWYRPDRYVPMETMADFFIGRILALVGLPPEVAKSAA
jgi:TetR/AcrR family transcriptional regulator, cholesterol catabolism regulator